MDFETIYNLITLFLMSALKFTLFGVLLRKTYTWTWLGRGLLVMFLFFGVVYGFSFLRLVGVDIPQWTNQGLRIIAVADCVVIFVALMKYPFPPSPARIQWSALLGWEKNDHPPR